jgi:hypothetical protein
MEKAQCKMVAAAAAAESAGRESYQEIFSLSNQ